VIANWDRLTRFVDDPRIPLDNNICYAGRGITNAMPRSGTCRVGGAHRGLAVGDTQVVLFTDAA
jgi:hypothetical protein